MDVEIIDTNRDVEIGDFILCDGSLLRIICVSGMIHLVDANGYSVYVYGNINDMLSDMFEIYKSVKIIKSQNIKLIATV